MKKFLLCFLVLIFCISNCIFAIPGIKDRIPTESGQYVFYKDNTFPQETYVGFLFYDDYTFGLRYFSPEALTGSKNIEVLVSLNSEKNAIELSGEKIITQVTNDDVDTMNYLHVLMYELGGMRKKINDKNLSKTVSVKEDFYQFGGDVTMTYESFIPVFNLKEIKDSKGKVLFELVKTGVLYDSTDTSFSDFAGLPKSQSENAISYDINTKAKKTKYKIADIQLKLDAQWSQVSENVLALGDAALLIVDTIEFAELAEDLPFTAEEYLTRLFSFTDSQTVSDFSQMKTTSSRKYFRMDSVSTNTETNETIRDCKYLLKKNDTTFVMVALTTFDSVYKANSKYFEKILSSAKIVKK